MFNTKAGYARKPNSKSEYRNSKQILRLWRNRFRQRRIRLRRKRRKMTEISIKMEESIFVLNFEHLNFDIVSYFVLRISDFLTIASNFLVFRHRFLWLRH